MSDFHSNTWIRIEKRIAIYFRDMFTCACCGVKYTRDDLTLDHIIPVSCGGSNHHTNLVTMCRSCNSSKGAKTLVEFISDTELYARIMNHVNTATLDVKSAKLWYANNKMEAPQMTRKIAA